MSIALLFILCMVSLTWLLKRTKAGYEWSKKGFKLNHLLFMNDLKLFVKRKNQIDSLGETVYLFSEDICMHFGMKKCGVLIMEREKVIGLPDVENVKDIDETGYTYLGILEIDKIKENKMKEKFTKEYLRWLRVILRSKLNGRNKIMAVNTWWFL